MRTQLLRIAALALVIGLVAALLAWLPPGFGGWRGERLLEVLDRGHGRAVVALAVAGDGERVASLDAGGSLKLWRLEIGSGSGEVAAETPAAAAGEQLLALAWTTDGDLVASRASGEVLRWPGGDLAAPPLREPLAAPATALAGLPDGRIAFGTGDGRVGVIAGDVVPVPSAVRHLAPGVGGELLVTTEGGDRLRLSWPDGGLATEAAFDDRPLAVVGSREGGWRWVETSGAVREATVGGGERLVAEALGRPPRSAAFAARGAFLALGGDDGTVLLRDLDRGRRVLLGAPVVAVAARPDGREVAISEAAGLAGVGQVTVRDVAGGEHRAGVFVPQAVTCLRWLGDSGLGLWLRSGERRRWNPASGALTPWTAASPLRCPRPSDERFIVRRLNQVAEPEVILEDRRSGWLTTLESGFSRLAEVTDRSLLDRLLGRFAWCGLRQDGTVLAYRHRPRWPLPLVFSAAIVAVFGLGRLASRRRRRLAMLPPTSGHDRSSPDDQP